MRFHSFLSFLLNDIGKDSEMKILIYNININNTYVYGSYTLLCESYIYMEGKMNVPKDVGQGMGELSFKNNGLVFL